MSSTIEVLSESLPRAGAAVGRACWFAVRTRSNHERIATARLLAKGVDAYLPTLVTRSRRRDRRAVVSRPLFAGYFFARFHLDQRDRIEVLQAPGVMHLVGFGGRPAAVPDWQIESVRIALESRNRADVVLGIGPGESVQVISGPLAGARGVVLKRREGNRLLISIDLLGRGLAVDMEAYRVAPRAEGNDRGF